jgi:hypothetical protein
MPVLLKGNLYLDPILLLHWLLESILEIKFDFKFTLNFVCYYLI